MALKNYYLILGLNFSASQEEIKFAYRNLAKKFHPDINPGDKAVEEKFKEISEAYNTLSDEENRRRYDVKFFYTKNAKISSFSNTNPKPKYKRKAEVPLTKRERRTIFFMLTGGVSFVAFMAVMSFFIPQYDEKEITRQVISLDKYRPFVAPEKTKSLSISTSDSPYEKYFGGDADSYSSRSAILVQNNLEHEVIVCLVEHKEPLRTVRNEYIEPGDSYRFTSIPTGTYYIKAYFGNIWQPTKKMNEGKILGGFENEAGFFKSDDRKNLYEISEKISGDNLVYFNYEIMLSKIFDEKSKGISEKEFFEK